MLPEIRHPAQNSSRHEFVLTCFQCDTGGHAIAICFRGGFSQREPGWNSDERGRKRKRIGGTKMSSSPAKGSLRQDSIDIRQPKASTYTAVEVSAPGQLRVVQRRVGEPGPGQVRIRVEACGICHTDAGTVTGIYPGDWGIYHVGGFSLRTSACNETSLACPRI